MSSVQIVMNRAMRPIYERASADRREGSLAPVLDAIAEAGLVASDGRLYLSAPETFSAPPASFDACEAERWVNKVHLDSSRSPDDPAWRHELVAQGLQLAKRLIAQAVELTTHPVQAVISLQSAEGKADPEIDFATGMLNIYALRSEADDLAGGIERSIQPTLLLTSSC